MTGDNANINFQRFVYLIAALYSIFLIYSNIEETSLLWPSIDNLFAVGRLLDESFLREDFFTNASDGDNPRSTFVFFVYVITEFLNLGLGGGLSFIQALILTLFPLLFFCTYIVSINHQLERKSVNLGKSFLVVGFSILSLIILDSNFSNTLTVAWWRPITYQATAQNVSILLMLSSFFMLRKNIYSVSFFLGFISSVFHPVSSLYTAVFLLLIGFRFEKSKREFLFSFLFFVPVFIGGILVRFLFDSDINLGDDYFAYIYAVVRHPHHYIPSEFGVISQSWSWVESYIYVSTSLFVFSFILYRLECSAWINALFGAIFYVFSVVFQYLFVELYPVKIFVVLGTSRATMFGPWMMCFFASLIIIVVIRRMNTSSIDFYLLVNKVRYGGLLICSSFVLFSFLALKTYFGSKFPDYTSSYSDLYHFAEKETESSDVFIFPRDGLLKAYFPLKANRAVFLGEGFPFSEVYFEEYEERLSLILEGRKASASTSVEISGYYRKLTPSDFVKISERFKLDWVVIEESYSSQFEYCSFSLNSAGLLIYSIDSLKECV